MYLDTKQVELFEFVKLKHKNQKRKYTGEPYYNHLLSVAEIISEFMRCAVEAALCHDLLEDTDCTRDELYNKMLEIGYKESFVIDTCLCVVELTDVFTHESYPNLNRSKRKQLEAERLGQISFVSQSIKYADLIDNTKSITGHDKDFAKVYLKEKQTILELMNKGNTVLYDLCKNQVNYYLESNQINIP